MTRRSYAKLTPREEQRIVALRAEGLTFEVIAARLGCSKGTVWNALHAHELRSQAADAPVRGQDCMDAIAKVRDLIKKTGGGR